MIIRSYRPTDYDQIVTLYKRSELYGGVFDEERDTAERLRKRVEADPGAIIVAEEDETIIGTVSLIEDGRVAWLYRFCVLPTPENLQLDEAVAQSLCETAVNSLQQKGHKQVLVYTSQDHSLQTRYTDLGFTKGSDYSCFFKDIT